MNRPTLAELAADHSQRRLPRKKRNIELRQAGYDPDGTDGKVYRDLLRQEIAKDTRKPNTGA